MDDEQDLLDSTVIVAIDGQKVAGRVTGVHDTSLEITLTIRQPAKGYTGVVGSTTLPGGQEISFDLGRHSFYSTLVIEVPRPRRAREAGAEAAEKPAAERRMYFRLPTECDVDVLETLGHGRDYMRARGKTINVSGGGMLVELNKPLLPGTYKFRVHLPHETLEVAGAVIRSKKQASLVMPVEFVDLHEVERSKLIRFIFNRMRNLRDDIEDKKSAPKEDPRYWRRREKYLKPPKPRYW
ncbi:MAG: PilZ domain-containing protein [Candidatus Sericytochromatia bacterium]